MKRSDLDTNGVTGTATIGLKAFKNTSKGMNIMDYVINTIEFMVVQEREENVPFFVGGKKIRFKLNN